MQKRKVKKPAYNCSQYTRYGVRACSNKEITEEELLNRFVAFLLDTRDTYSEYLTTVDFKIKDKQTKSQLSAIEKEFKNVKSDLKLLNIKKMRESTESSEFSEVTVEINTEIENDLQKRYSELKKQIENLKLQTPKIQEVQIKNAISIMDKIIESERPSRKLLEMLLDKIIIYKDRVVEFKLKVNI